MPAHGDILTPVQIKLLTAWVWGLSNKPDAQARPAPPAGPAD
jgi:cytochrome c oxidase cbb3-type subunit 3